MFGEESLFQALNRTVTPQGTQRLVRWLLAPCQDPQRITHRQQAGAELVGMGFLIEKGFQAGGKELREMGIHVESLAIIDSLDNNQIKLR